MTTEKQVYTGHVLWSSSKLVSSLGCLQSRVLWHGFTMMNTGFPDYLGKVSSLMKWMSHRPNIVTTLYSSLETDLNSSFTLCINLIISWCLKSALRTFELIYFKNVALSFLLHHISGHEETYKARVEIKIIFQSPVLIVGIVHKIM